MAATRAIEDINMADAGMPVATSRVEPCPRWVRAFAGGVAVADSRRVMLGFIGGRMPVYYFPLDDVRTDLLVERVSTEDGERAKLFYDLRAGDRVIDRAAWRFVNLPDGASELEGHVAFYWNRLDHWFEEDDEVFVHARDPYHRVDVLNSSRHVRVFMDGEVLADSQRPRLLFETGLPTRYYLPRLDVRMDLLGPSATVSHCPYKGRTVHFDLQLGDRTVHDIAWSYPYPIPECPKIENLVCFYDERVERIEVDGEVQPRPTTPWS